MSDECFCENPPSSCTQICDVVDNLINGGGSCSAECGTGDVMCVGEDKCIHPSKVRMN